jgi:hypothetical protein
MIAILTKYIPATNNKGSRIKAYTVGQSTTIAYDYALDEYTLHLKAAQHLCHKMQWYAPLVGGSIKGGYAFVFIEPAMAQHRLDNAAY